ncbi:hypothetical protein H696_00042 [Fonticula alba]|uniref:Protein YIPF n=1 Tax=Fonticula alba TaxID=691883 RepID=A0A058ZDF4_FONAL|nr:hypothetical protein H696_00042 [Fonticula alba]KCV72450.1 hypothetical protein H696_00042 [Fonticula alba]|eukprot:XP_009492151.1 hypothetical protein H696_00042 [Fonticula alba]
MSHYGKLDGEGDNPFGDDEQFSSVPMTHSESPEQNYAQPQATLLVNGNPFGATPVPTAVPGSGAPPPGASPPPSYSENFVSVSQDAPVGGGVHSAYTNDAYMPDPSAPIGVSVDMSATAPAAPAASARNLATLDEPVSVTIQQAAVVFTIVFVIVWIGAGIVTLNAKLLGGNVSFFQTVCVLGYCLLPLDISALVCMFVSIVPVRLAVASVCTAWSTYIALTFLNHLKLQNRRALAVYPLFLFYFIMGWMVVISKSII